MEHLKSIIELFLDSSKHWGLKFSILISIIGFVFITDFSLNISQNIFTSNKLDNLEKIQKLKKGYENDSLNLLKIKSIELKIIEKKHYSDYLIDLNSFFNFSEKVITKSKILQKNLTKNTKTVKIVKPKITEIINIRSNFWMTVTSSYIFIIVFIFALFMPITERQKITFKTLFNYFEILLMSLGLTFLFTWLSFKIPLILNIPVLNYILNMVIHFTIIFAISKVAQKN